MLFVELVGLVFQILVAFLIGVFVVWLIPSFLLAIFDELKELRRDRKAAQRRVQQVSNGFFKKFVEEQRNRNPYAYKARHHAA
jgi:uncharacterized protein YqhQ